MWDGQVSLYSTPLRNLILIFWLVALEKINKLFIEHFSQLSYRFAWYLYVKLYCLVETWYQSSSVILLKEKFNWNQHTEKLSIFHHWKIQKIIYLLYKINLLINFFIQNFCQYLIAPASPHLRTFSNLILFCI